MMNRKKGDRRTVACACCQRVNLLTPAQAKAGVLCGGCCLAFALAAPLLIGYAEEYEARQCQEVAR